MDTRDIAKVLPKLHLSYREEIVKKIKMAGQITEESRENFIKYLQDNFPLHMGDEEPDEELRKLCQWVADGKDKGFNERLQAIQKGVT